MPYVADSMRQYNRKCLYAGFKQTCIIHDVDYITLCKTLLQAYNYYKHRIVAENFF